MENATELFVGIDIAKTKVDVHIYPTKATAVFATDDAGLQRLVEWVNGARPKRIVFESTGGYGRRVQAAFQAVGVGVHCVPAQRIRMFATGLGIKAKTDPLDAEVIARFAAQALLVDKPPPSPGVLALKDLVIRRMQLVSLRSREKNHRETLPAEHLRSSLKLQAAIDDNIYNVESAMLAHVEAQNDLRKRALALRTIEGCGLATICALLALLPELGTLTSKQAGSLVGVAPFNNDSGDREHPRSICGGRRRLRAALYMTALHSVRADNSIGDLYRRLVAAGKPQKVALTAAIRKLVVIANARVRDALAPAPAAQPTDAVAESSTSTKKRSMQWPPRRSKTPARPKRRKRTKRNAKRAKGKPAKTRAQTAATKQA
jgi:transposase